MKNFIHRLFRYLVPARRSKAKRGLHLSTEMTTKYLHQMEMLMKQRRPFLQSGYSIQSLAVELGIPSYTVSLLINRKMGINFNDYLNRYRVQYCQELIHKGAAGNLNLKGLATNCGFHNRNTFTNAFKKFTGQTPSSYAKIYRQSQHGHGKYVFFSHSPNGKADNHFFNN
jgi:AraC-like DNA-binding protein